MRRKSLKSKISQKLGNAATNVIFPIVIICNGTAVTNEDGIVSLSDVDMIISARTYVAYILYGFIIFDYRNITRNAGSNECFIKDVCLIETLLVLVGV